MKQASRPIEPCLGPRSAPNRREFLRLGLAGLTGLSLPELYRLRALAAPAVRRRSLIVVWLHGGASHIETYDPKPLAPSEYRGPYRPISTTVPGLQFCELLPQQARRAHRFTLLRGLVHGGVCHDSGPQQLFTGHPVPLARNRPAIPDLFAVTHSLHANTSQQMPAYVGAPPIPYLGPGFLGSGHEPFAIHGDPSSPSFSVPNVDVAAAAERRRLSGRRQLRGTLDDACRALDGSGPRLAFDDHQEQAWNMLTSGRARRAFDLSREDPKMRDRYGRNAWGQQCLLARRLVEAGVEVVTTSLNGRLSGSPGSWDDHAVNGHIFEEMRKRAPYMDQAVAALLDDLQQSGLERDVVVVVGGEFGRTPRISYDVGTQSGVRQPGRDHYPRVNAFVFFGGGIPGGQVLGATDRQGASVVAGHCGVGDFAATIYHHLGIDATRTTITGRDGRPHALVAEGRVIPELAGA